LAPASQANAGAQVARTWAEREQLLLPKAAEINDREIAAGNGPVSARKLAGELHVSQANAGKIVKALAATGPGSGGAGTSAPPPVANAAPSTPAPDWLASTVRTREQPGHAPDQTSPSAGVHPAATPDAPVFDSSGAPGPVPPGALPPQREAPVEHANGAETPTP
jgi:hypothetical protein